MAGSGKSLENPGGKASASAPSPVPSPAPSPQTIPAAFPGQLQAIAAQLGQGFGQNPADILAQLQNLHRPMSVTPPGGGAGTGTTTPPAHTPSPGALINRGTQGIKMKNGKPYQWNGSGWVPAYNYHGVR